MTTDDHRRESLPALADTAQTSKAITVSATHAPLAHGATRAPRPDPHAACGARSRADTTRGPRAPGLIGA